MPCHTATFCYTPKHHNDVVYFAHGYPYTYSQMIAHLRGLSAHPCVRHSELCRSLLGNPVPLLTITNFACTAAEMRAVRRS